MQGSGESAPKRRKTSDSLINLLAQSRENNNYSEVLEILRHEDFESPFLAFARLDSEEDAIKEAKALYEECVKVFTSGHTDSKEVVDLLLKNKSELGGGNVLHGLISEAAFAPRNQAAVYAIFFELSELGGGNVLNRPISEQDLMIANRLGVHPPSLKLPELGGGNVLHGLISEASLVLVDRLGVHPPSLKSVNGITKKLESQENENRLRPFEFARGFLSSEICEIEKLFLKILDLRIQFVGLLHDLMGLKNHEMVAKIHDHPKYNMSDDEYIMFLVYRHKYAEMMPKLQTEKKNSLSFKYISDALIHKRNIAERLGDNKWRVTEGTESQDFEGSPMETALICGLKESFKALVANGESVDFSLLRSVYRSRYPRVANPLRSGLLLWLIKDTKILGIHANDQLLTRNPDGKTIIHDIIMFLTIRQNPDMLGVFIAVEVIKFLIYNLKQKFKDEKNPEEALREFLNAKDNFGRSALHELIASYQYVQQDVADIIIGILIENGADINLPTGRIREGASVTRLALGNELRVIELLKMLIVHDLDLKTPDVRGEMPLHCVARCVQSHNPSDLVDYMITFGADPNSVNRSRKTALMIAAEKGNFSMFLSLFEREDVDKTKRDYEGNELLQLAALGGGIRKLNFLLERGTFNVHHVNNNGHNALCSAALSGNIAVVKKFIQLGLNPTLRNSEGNNIILDLLDNKILKTKSAKQKEKFSEIKNMIIGYINIYDKVMGVLYVNLGILPENLRDKMLFAPNSATAISFKDYDASINHDRDVSMSILLKHAREKPQEIRFL